jgi:hypothetical protein
MTNSLGALLGTRCHREMENVGHHEAGNVGHCEVGNHREAGKVDHQESCHSEWEKKVQGGEMLPFVGENKSFPGRRRQAARHRFRW